MPIRLKEMDSNREDLGSSSNPQRPPLTEEEKSIIESDKIGDTAYSKKWVLSVLMHLVQDNNEEPKNEINSDDSSNKNNETRPETEMDSLLEEELCELWDMTMDSDVSRYLEGEHAIDLILDVIIKTKSLRKLEICLGILANMACTQEVCKIIVEHPTLSNVTLFHIDNPDVRTLIELSRLINACLSNKEVCKTWIKCLKNQSVINSLVFILDNSLNVELLDVVTDAVDKLLDNDDSILDDLSTTATVNIICDVYRRTAVKSPQTIQNLLHILQLISTSETGVSALASVQDVSNIARLILKEGNKYLTPLTNNLSSLVSSCSILKVLMSAEDKKIEVLTKDDVKVLSTILSLTVALWESVPNNDTEAVEHAVNKEYLGAVMEFLSLFIAKLSNIEVGEDILKKLRKQKEQMLKVITILEETPSYESIVEKMTNFMKFHAIAAEHKDSVNDNEEER